MPFQEGNKLSGSRKGRPNRIKRDAREAIARFVDRNAGKLQRWLDAISDGLREADTIGPDGQVIPGKWIVTPNPEKAFVLFQSVIEYHVPKLSRREIVKDPPRDSRVIDSSKLTAEEREQMRQIILRQMQAEPALLEQQASEVPRGTDFVAGLGYAQAVDCIGDSTEVRGDASD